MISSGRARSSSEFDNNLHDLASQISSGYERVGETYCSLDCLIPLPNEMHWKIAAEPLIALDHILEDFPCAGILCDLKDLPHARKDLIAFELERWEQFGAVVIDGEEEPAFGGIGN
jgi:hypothetical protein